MTPPADSERYKHLTLRTRIKRLVRKTIRFSKSIQTHDIVMGLFSKRYAFGQAVSICREYSYNDR
jgi:hypothetical protein